MALAALGAVGAVANLDVGFPTAEAAPSVSPFAGTYVGGDPATWKSYWTVMISDGGRITGSYKFDGRNQGSISGRVSSDGSYLFTVSVTYRTSDNGRTFRWVTRSYDSAGNMASDLDGNIVGTEDSGRTFSCLRQ